MSLKRPLQALLLAPVDDMWVMVITGEKKITIREGARDFVEGSPVMLCCHLASYVLMADVTKVDVLPLKEVSLKHLQADGFNSWEDALVGLQRFYPTLKRDDVVTVVQWENVRGKLVDDYREHRGHAE